MASKFLPALSCIISFAAITTSCSTDDTNVREGAGRIAPHLSVEPGVVYADDVNHAFVIDTLPPPGEFSIRLVDDISGQSHIWDRAATFDITELYRSGSYTMTAWYGDPISEGFDGAFYMGETRFDVTDAYINPVSVDCRLWNSMIDFGFDSTVTEYFDSISVLIHSPYGTYIKYPSWETLPVFLRPGDVWLAIDATDHTGRRAIFRAADIRSTQVGYYYHVQISMTDDESAHTSPAIRLSFSELIETDDILIPITDSLFESRAPQVTCYGFTEGQPLRLPEGTSPGQPIGFTVTGDDISSVTLTAISLASVINNWATEIDLMSLSADSLELLSRAGIDVKRSPSEVSVDVSGLIPNIERTTDFDNLQFTVIASNRNGCMSSPATLLFEPQEVRISVVSEPLLTAGSNIGRVTLSASDQVSADFFRIDLRNEGRDWHTVPVTGLHPDDSGNYMLTFEINPDYTGSVDLRITYCGVERYLATLRRTSPRYTVEIDPFALKADIRILPFETSELAYITTNANVYVNGHVANVIERDSVAGMLTIAGLTENSDYIVRLSVIDRPQEDDYSQPVTIHTERAVQLPNGDFEDTDEVVSGLTLDCGGRYSQNYVEIYNRQNHQTFTFSTPSRWANTNAKTFSRSARLQNTWYMQPSVMTVSDTYSGAYAVCLTTVGWDTDGEPIADYLQESEPFVNYSRTVPAVSHRAVGRLFMGSYTFDPATGTEHFAEGMSLRSRPSALNGYYRYVPSEDMPDDRGIALVAVYGTVDGKTEVIAHAELLLAPATDYTAFSVPLEYSMFGITATSVRVMLASSWHIGSIAEETLDNITPPDLPEACMRGSSLWIDRLTFSY